MTPIERALWLRLQRKAGTLGPETSRDLMAAYRIVRESLSDAELAQAIRSGRIEQVLDQALLDRAFLPLRQRLHDLVSSGFDTAVRDLPKAGTVDGVLAVGFNTLSPKVIDGIRKLESRVIVELQTGITDQFRATVENGLRDGRSTSAVARDLRAMLGMSPTQAENAIKYRTKLEAQGLSGDALDRAARAYERKAIALNANTNSQTATRDALRLGNHLSWQDAIDRGIVQESQLEKVWVTVGDDRVRPEHVAMSGQVAGFNDAFSNGEVIPGESTWNCRCNSRYRVKRALRLPLAA